MSNVIGNSINSAILSSQFGIQNAYEGMTQATLSIAQKTAQQSVEDDGAGQLLAQTSLQSLSNTKNILPTGGDSFTSDIMALQINSNNAIASASVLETANGAVGLIIDTLA
jgi:hypothetical protein